MLFPNLIWAVSERRLPHYELARLSELSESKLSRGLSGRRAFNDEEKCRIAEVLGYSSAWLFQEVKPPRAACLGRGTRTTQDAAPPAVVSNGREI